MKYIDASNATNSKDCFCLIKSVDKKTTKSGKPYLDLVLSDSTGEVSAKLWDYNEEIHGGLQANMPVKVRGTLEIFKGNDQFKIIQIRPLIDSDDFDISELVASSPADSNWMLSEVYRITDDFEDEDLKKIVKFLLAKRGEVILKAPAAVNMHHAECGGLLFHTLSIIRMAQRTCEVYQFLDKDLLIAGAIVHDLGKIDEMETNELGLASKYTVQGELIGHLVKGAIDISKAADELGIPEETALLLEHMAISHHGIPDYGAAKRPMFAEAEVLSVLDNLDATLFELASAINDVPTGSFSSKKWELDNRKIYNHGRTFGIPTNANLK